MRLLAWLGGLRTVLAVLTAITALHMGLVVVGNVTDYGTNLAFVQHVLAMDTTFRAPHMMWRAVTDHSAVTAAYVAIILWEALTAVVLLAGFVAWVRVLAVGRGFDAARHLSSCGWLMLVMLFGGGFIVIGGEWFQMWQSSKWNGLQPALQNFLIGSVGLVLAHLGQAGSTPGEHLPPRDRSRTLVQTD
jgi:predicted small integral membrane protein